MKRSRAQDRSVSRNGHHNGKHRESDGALDLLPRRWPAKSLDAAGIRHGSTLSSLGRGCLSEWGPWFEPLRQDEFDLLDIGCGNGSSLRLWREWFPAARLVGIDARRSHLSLSIPGCRVVQGDQVEFETYRSLLQEYRFRLVIADGSLHGRDQWQTFRLLLPWLDPGAIYACAGFDPVDVEVEREAVSLFADLGKAAVSPWFRESAVVRSSDIEPLLRRVASVTFGQCSIVVTTGVAEA